MFLRKQSRKTFIIIHNFGFVFLNKKNLKSIDYVHRTTSHP
jgi:hypothetical protein